MSYPRYNYTLLYELWTTPKPIEMHMPVFEKHYEFRFLPMVLVAKLLIYICIRYICCNLLCRCEEKDDEAPEVVTVRNPHPPGIYPPNIITPEVVTVRNPHPPGIYPPIPMPPIPERPPGRQAGNSSTTTTASPAQTNGNVTVQMPMPHLPKDQSQPPLEQIHGGGESMATRNSRPTNPTSGSKPKTRV